MKRIVMLAAASLMAMALGACGDNVPKKPGEVKPEAVVEHHDTQDQQTVTPTATEEAPASTNDANSSTNDSSSEQ